MMTRMLLTLALAGCASVPKASEPVTVILDTDFATDVDDAGAIAVLHALADLGEAKPLAILHDTSFPYAVSAIGAINAYYGRPELPVGAYRGDFLAAEANPYVRAVAKDQNTPRPAAVDLYRRVLSDQPDQSVTIVSVGFLTNLDRLMKSDRDLVARKVKRLVIMGGGFPTRARPEFNLSHAGLGPLSKRTLEAWPTPILFSGFEIGETIHTGAALENTPVDNPVREAYRVFHGGVVKDRWSWDQTAVLAAVRDPERYWDLQYGTIRMREDGGNSWSPEGQRHAYLKPRMPIADLTEEISRLMTQAPRGR